MQCCDGDLLFRKRHRLAFRIHLELSCSVVGDAWRHKVAGLKTGLSGSTYVVCVGGRADGFPRPNAAPPETIGL